MADETSSSSRRTTPEGTPGTTNRLVRDFSDLALRPYELQSCGWSRLPAPAALSILTTTFAEGRERNVALGVWGAASGSGGAAGVLLGGALTSAFDWSLIFFIDIPVGVAVLVLTPILVRESRAETAGRHFDIAGATAITGGLMLLVYALTRAATHGWTSGSTIVLLAASAALIASFQIAFWALAGIAFAGAVMT